MICLICRQAQIEHSFTTVKLENAEINLTVRGVPASVCPNCGDAYLDESAATRLLQIVKRSIESGEPMEFLDYSITDK
jgi:YgiT-type zinc finger domain-containing protein